MLTINNLKVARDGKNILNGVNLQINSGEVHALMGPNGSGKSTLASALIGHPDIEILAGSKVLLETINLLDLEPDLRLKEGLFLAFQYPVEIPGVPFVEFLRLAYNNVKKYRNPEYRDLSPFKFKKLLESRMDELKMPKSFLDRNLNEGFSGGEKKKSEILQMSMLEPKFAVLDETDSGLDVSALQIVAKDAKKLAKDMNIGLLVITHYKRILEYLNPDYVHILVDGKIVESGKYSLAETVDKDGYEKYLNNEK